MTTFTFIFVIFLTIATFTQLWLARRQAFHIEKNKTKVPPEFKDKISEKDHSMAANYSLARLNIQKLAIITSCIMLVIWTLGGFLAWLNQFVINFQISPIAQGVILLCLIFLIEMFINFPLEIYSTFKIESKYGFNRNTPLRFMKDKLLQTLIFAVLGVPILYVIIKLMTEAGIYWWIWTWITWMGFSFFLSWAFPTLIAPIFNKFEPLENASLKERLEKLLTKSDFRSNGMFVMDGSKRSSHGNAYFTGIGKNKRIVFFDTLLDCLSDEQIEAVLAHELGHFKHKHVSKMIKLNGLLSLAGLALLGWLSQQNWFFSSFGIENYSEAASLAIFFLIIPVFTFFLTPLKSLMSRKHEYEADNFAAEITDAQWLIDGLTNMYKDNASTVTSDSIYSAFYYSHPSAIDRVSNLVNKLNNKVL
tara:strand:- start:31076 stop:32332 length:1257 start_codon:yes stop_codon:yes gene_type:complete